LLGADQIPAELIKTEGNVLCSEIQKVAVSTWNKEVLPEQWVDSIIVPSCVSRFRFPYIFNFVFYWEFNGKKLNSEGKCKTASCQSGIR
jgi:hypothetical protein